VIFEHLGLLLGTVDSAGLAALKADSRVKDIVGTPELRLIQPVAARAARSSKPVTWGIEAMELPKLWSDPAKLSGKGVLIGHLDTGVDGTHPALAGAIAEFADFDAMGQRVPGNPPAHDTGQHGTHTAGTIAARQVGPIAFGCAPGAYLASGIVADGVTFLSSPARILGGLEWLVALGVRVLSMSIGLPGFLPDFQPVIQALRANNVLPVIAIGNDGPGTSRSPGNYDDVLSVGAIDRSGAVADFSCSQTFLRPEDPLVPDIVAPGVDVTSSIPGGGTLNMSGTSMAAPHVAGLAALLLEADGTATADDLEAAILGSCTLGPKMPIDRANRGLPNGPKALALLRSRTARVAA
jgi:subtilisin family serine protease